MYLFWCGVSANKGKKIQQEKEEHLILGTFLIPLTALFDPHTPHTHNTNTHHMGWLFRVHCPHHIHIITQQLILFPKSQYLGVHWENPIGAAHFFICFSIQGSTVLQTAFVFFQPAFPMFSAVNHPLNPCTTSIINNVSSLLLYALLWRISQEDTKTHKGDTHHLCQSVVLL